MKKHVLRVILCSFLIILISGNVMAQGDIEINEENFPDEGFRNYVLNNIDKDNDGILSYVEIKEVEEIYLDKDVFEDKITSLKGLEYFTDLIMLHIDMEDVDAESITQIDLSPFTELKRLYLINLSKIENIDFSKNQQLDSLALENLEKLHQIDISQNTALESLFLTNLSKIKNVDLSKNQNLENLALENLDELNKIDISNNKKLNQLALINLNKIDNIDSSHNTALEGLYIKELPIKEIDLKGLTKLNYIQITDSDLESFDTSYFTEENMENKFITLDLENNKLPYLNLNGTVLSPQGTSFSQDIGYVPYEKTEDGKYKLDFRNIVGESNLENLGEYIEDNCLECNVEYDSNTKIITFDKLPETGEIKIRYRYDAKEPNIGAEYRFALLVKLKLGSIKVTFDENYEEKNDDIIVELLKGESISSFDGSQYPEDPKREGYVFKEWNTKPDGSGEIFEENTVVEEDIIVYGIWEEEEPKPEPEPEPKPEPEPEPESNESYRPIVFSFDTNDTKKDIHITYIYGYPDGMVKPDGNITRAEAAAMLARLKELPLDHSSAPDFIDTTSDVAWYNKAVNAVVKAGIMEGYPDGSFKPDAPITRAEFAQMIMPIDKENTALAPFADIKEHWGITAIHQGYGNERLHGYPDGSFMPNGNITRAEAATILNSLFERMVREEGLLQVENPKDLKEFSDLTKEHWGYYEMVEATNTHEYHRLKGKKVEEGWIRILQGQ